MKAIVSDLEGVFKDVEAIHQEYTEALASEDDTDIQELDLKEEDMEKMNQALYAVRSEIINIQKLPKPATTASETAKSETST